MIVSVIDSDPNITRLVKKIVKSLGVDILPASEYLIKNRASIERFCCCLPLAINAPVHYKRSGRSKFKRRSKSA